MKRPGILRTLLALAVCGLAWWSGDWLAEQLSLRTLGLLLPLGVIVVALSAMQARIDRHDHQS